MVKFSKQLEGQLVPEWRSAYVTYKLLKKDLKTIKESVEERRLSDGGSQFPGKTRHGSNFSRVQESLESFVALTGHALAGNRSNRRSRRDSILLVNVLDGNPWEVYESVLADVNESNGQFFARLDSEFNKVNHFYRTKEKDFVEHADTLEKQMHALAEMQRTFVEQRQYRSLSTGATSDDENQDDLEAGSVSMGSLNIIEKGNDAVSRTSFYSGGVGSSLDSHADGAEENGETSSGSPATSPEEFPENKAKSASPQRVMRMRIPMTNPRTTISVLSHSLWEDVLKQGHKHSSSSGDRREKAAVEFNVTKKKIQLAEKMLRAAFIEYYRGLTLLRSYSSLNMVAFAKILKKYDKVSGQRASATYLKAVESAYFNTSDKIIKLMEKVEELFTTHFASSNRQKAMMSLRPTHKRASHNVTFVLGLFSGGSLALLVVLVVLMHNLLPKYRPIDPDRPGPVHKVGDTVYFETVFPVFSMIALILLHMFMYGVNIYFWRRLRINYSFIFEFQPGTELRHREVLMVTSVITILLMGAMVGQLTLHSTTLSPYVDFIPFALLLGLVILLVFPLNFCYRSSRLFFLHAILHILGSPLYKVVLSDFFLADQLTSQVPMLRNLQYVMCYYFGGFFRTGSSDKCFGNNSYKGFTYLISLLPYWWRLMQCVRRFIDEADNAHIANGGKYLSALVAVAIRIQYGRDSTNAWLGMYVFSSVVATVYQLYWDLVVDWGLLRKESVYPWLRDRLIMPRKKYLYFLSMVINVVLRLAWLQSVARFEIGGLNEQFTNFVFASLEVIRRGHWNFYRLENEHLNNVGKFRATRTVPLPFEDPSTQEDY